MQEGGTEGEGGGVIVPVSAAPYNGPFMKAAVRHKRQDYRQQQVKEGREKGLSDLYLPMQCWGIFFVKYERYLTWIWNEKMSD